MVNNMSVSIFDLFSIGIGPSSSHTVGPMRAARRFLEENKDTPIWSKISTISIDLYGSLACTGVGHGTNHAIMLGLMGHQANTIDVKKVLNYLADVKLSGTLSLLDKVSVPFKKDTIQFHKRNSLALHANGMKFTLWDANGKSLISTIFYSIGGGFIKSEFEMSAPQSPVTSLPFMFDSADSLLKICISEKKTIAELIMANELKWRKESDIEFELKSIWRVMQDCVSTGCNTDGILPGGLNVKRRASALYKTLTQTQFVSDPSAIMDWVSVFALAVNEENAAGGRVVTAPTNGAAGIIPAVLHYYHQFYHELTLSDLKTFFMTAGAIGLLYKLKASISGAEMGCQGEVGVAASMAAAGLTALRNGTPVQIENAAEIAMEHHLGLTCDPVKGLVQIPCIERNTMGAIKAINAARLASHGDGTQKVSLDKVIRTMKQTGDDMKTRYKETSEGGLAINVVEC